MKGKVLLNFLKQAKLSKLAPFSIIVLLLATFLGTSHILPSILPYFVFIVFGLLALYLQYSSKIIPLIFEKPAKNSWWKIVPIVIVTLIIAYVLSLFSSTVANSALGNGSQSDKLLRLFWISVSLIGEEIITASLTFPFYTLIHKKIGDRGSWLYAAIIGSLLFGLLHFRTYNWNLYQMMLPIGLGRLPFTWLWIKSDSLWSAIIAHIIYDLIVFLPMVFQ
ncbi:hypothetical protein FC46_GL000442 [Lactobacillus kalixensis DSM 16043]|uniref:CAAX prenyl protease 2/Lysostaphin resistance protein A-like domain-containing protein n=1 Tax=Lactobacillus kalixensis DSM 16043 TaxID=1423763 RepID=A0A0R1UFA3_9LACO|nr:hypothetical protein FC46_GL000442 [Lactobacillus kalixensis DSM 16043]